MPIIKLLSLKSSSLTHFLADPVRRVWLYVIEFNKRRGKIYNSTKKKEDMKKTKIINIFLFS